MGEKNKAEPARNIDNRLRSFRMAKHLSQGDIARMAGITRQAVCAIEANHYLPTTAVALRLAGALGCRVEDLFSLKVTGEELAGELVGGQTPGHSLHTSMRVKVARVGSRLIVRPVTALGEVLAYTVPADGLLPGDMAGPDKSRSSGNQVTVRLLRDRRALEQEISVAGCDPAIFLAGEHLRRHRDTATVVGWTMGSAAALEALKRGEVHVAGLHIVDAKSGESNLPYLRRHLKVNDFCVVTFATWEEGLLVQPGNPKGIRDAGDLVRRDVAIVNREEGAGARLLLDQLFAAKGVSVSKVRGYTRLARSHFHVARLISEKQVDAGVGIRSAAQVFGVDFIPLREARYDLVVPKAYLAAHPSLGYFLETIVSRPFRTEVSALGGYDTSETGKVRELKAG